MKKAIIICGHYAGWNYTFGEVLEDIYKKKGVNARLANEFKGKINPRSIKHLREYVKTNQNDEVLIFADEIYVMDKIRLIETEIGKENVFFVFVCNELILSTNWSRRDLVESVRRTRPCILANFEDLSQWDKSTPKAYHIAEQIIPKLYRVKKCEGKKIIALSGVAGVGKDTLFHHLAIKLNEIEGSVASCRFSFADALKRELKPIADVMEMTRAQKDEFRPVMVAYGEYKRRKDKNYFTKMAIKEIKKSQCKYNIITDARYLDEIVNLESYFGEENVYVFVLNRKDLKTNRNIEPANATEKESIAKIINGHRHIILEIPNVLSPSEDKIKSDPVLSEFAENMCKLFILPERSMNV